MKYELNDLQYMQSFSRSTRWDGTILKRDNLNPAVSCLEKMAAPTSELHYVTLNINRKGMPTKHHV